MKIPKTYHFQTCVLSVQARSVKSPIVRKTPAIKVSHSQVCIEKIIKLWFIIANCLPHFLDETVVLIESSTFLKFLHSIPELFTLHWIAFEISLDIVGHTFGKLGNSTSTYAIHVYESLVVEFIDERKSIPEKVSHFEFEFVMIFFGKTLSYLLYLIL